MLRAPGRSVIHLGRPATWEDLDRVPEGMIGEIVAGELVVLPRPDAPHARASSRLGMVLGGPFDMGVGGPGGWIILDEPRVRFGDDIRVPDLAGWHLARWADVPRRGPIPIAPDWICEVLSRSTERADRTEKLDLYARARVGHVWLLGPVARTLEVLRLAADGWLLVKVFAADERIRAEPFDAVEIDLAQVWAGVPEEPDEE